MNTTNPSPTYGDDGYSDREPEPVEAGTRFWKCRLEALANFIQTETTEERRVDSE